MGRSIALGCAAAMAVVGVGAAAPVSWADAAPAAQIAFADAGPLALSKGGKPASVLVVSQVSHPVHLQISLDAADKPVTTSPVRVTGGNRALSALHTAVVADVPGGGELALAVAPAGVGDAYLVVTDAADDLTIRRLLTVGVAQTGKPAVTSWKGTVDVGPFADADTVGVIPLAPGQACGASGADSPTAVLVAGDNRITVTTTCSHGVVTMSADHLGDVPAGSYSGTLTVAGVDVSLELTRRAPWWEAVVALLIGILVALVVRSLAGRRSTWVLRADLAKLPAASAPDDSAWRTAAQHEIDDTVQALNAACADDTMWPRWTRGRANVLRWLFVPSARAKKIVADTESARAKAQAGIEAWNGHAATALAGLARAGASTNAAMAKLAGRARDMAADPAHALTEPGEPEPGIDHRRKGVAGLVAVLDEAQAIATVALLATRTSSLADQLSDAAPPEGTGDALVDLVIARAWRENRAEVFLRLTAIEQEIARSDDAVALLADGVEARLHDAVLIADRLALPPSPPPRDGLREVGVAAADDSTPVTGWQWIPSELQRFGRQVALAASRHAVVIGDLIAVVVAAIVVVTAGVATLYSGQAWGGTLDFVTAILAAVGGTLALTPVFAAIDNLGNGTDPPAAGTDAA